jgi:leucyl/phenylalanyl-tRNA--protein transferase
MMRRAQAFERGGVHGMAVALAREGPWRRRGRDEAEPFEVFDDRGGELGPAPRAIVVFEAEQDAPVERLGEAPHVDRVHDVTEVQIPCRRRRKAGDRPAHALRPHVTIVIQTMIPWLHGADPFPPVETALADPNGLLAAGGDLSPARLLDAYTRGIFPWFSDGDPPLWWSPDPRMVLHLDELHVARSLRRVLRSGRYTVTFDRDFAGVMAGCAEPRTRERGTWITPSMVQAYTTLAALGHAHSVESWEGGTLAGGLYGVAIGRMFFGESMFARGTDASKVALVCLARQLRRWGFRIIDCQMSTPHLASLGAREVPRAQFMEDVRRLVRLAATPSPWTADTDLLDDLGVAAVGTAVPERPTSP